MKDLLQIGDVFITSKLDPEGARWLVIAAVMNGGGTGMGPHDAYPDGWKIRASQLRQDGEYDPEGEQSEFYQSGCFCNEILPADIRLVGKMVQTFAWVSHASDCGCAT
jgi:hypothetical protein